MIFVDTGAWYVCYVKQDPNYSIAEDWLSHNKSPLVTTDYILHELFTLFRARGQSSQANRLGPAFINNEFAQIERISFKDFGNAWNVFQSYQD